MSTSFRITYRMTRFFFDRQAVISRVDNLRLRALRFLGGRTRLIARRSIRRRGKRTPPAPAGSPPYSRTGKLREGILFAFDPANKSVVIGPVILNQVFLLQGRPVRGTVPQVLEEGGRIGIVERKVVGSNPLYKWWRADLRYNKDSSKYDYRIRFVVIQPHPYMAPAAEKAVEGLPEQLKDQI